MEVLFFDTETTGTFSKDQKYDKDFEVFPHIVSISWKFKGVETDLIVKPEGYEIPKECTEIHGISTEMALDKGVPLAFAIDSFINDAINADKIVAHNIYFDTSIVKANSLRLRMPYYYDKLVVPALDKEKRICTMNKTIKFVGAKFPNGKGLKWPTLTELYQKLFNDNFEAHASINDVRALERSFDELVKQGIICLE